MASKEFAVGFSLVPAVTAGYSYVQNMLLNLLHLQVEQWQLLQEAAVLACGVEIRTAVLRTSALGVASWIYSRVPTNIYSCYFMVAGQQNPLPPILCHKIVTQLTCTALLMVVTVAFRFALCSMELIQQKKIEMGTLL